MRANASSQQLVESCYVAICLVPLVVRSLTLPLDGDEGFYLLTARLVEEGSILYRDLFFPQMPFVPFVYAKWIEWFGPSWVGARVLAAIFGCALSLLLYVRLRLIAGRMVAGAGVVLLGTHAVSGAWFGTVKTYGISALFAFAAYLLVEKARSGDKRGDIPFLAGLFAGLATLSRLLFVAVIPGLLLPLLQAAGGNRWRTSARFLFGLLCGIGAILVMAVTDGTNVWFNNVTYHTLRTNHAWWEGLDRKLLILKNLLGLGAEGQFSGPVLFVLLCSAIVYAVHLCVRRLSPDCALGIALLLFLAHLIPNPTFVQYYVVVIPFLIVCAVHGLVLLADRFSLHRRFVAVLLAVMALACSSDTPDRGSLHFALDEAQAVSGFIDLHVPQDSVGFSAWPGFLVEARSQPLPGFENHFSRRIVDKLSAEQAAKLHIGTLNELQVAVKAGSLDFLLLPRQGSGLTREIGSIRALAISSGYVAIFAPAGQLLYVPEAPKQPIPPDVAEPLSPPKSG